MDADKTAALSSGYRSRKIDETSHPDDWMFAGYVNGMADYLVVGVCGARVVHAALTASPTEQARRPLANFAFGLAGPTQLRVGDHQGIAVKLRVDEAGQARSHRGAPIVNAEFCIVKPPLRFDLATRRRV